MLRILLILSAISAFIYLLFAFKGWLGQLRRRKHSPDAPPRAYFWGLTFAVLFHYGFPLWWWRYGLRNALKLMIFCVSSVMVVKAILGATGAIDVDGLGESIAASLFIAVPIRAIAGLWLAKHDAVWRSAILLQRKAHLQAVET